MVIDGFAKFLLSKMNRSLGSSMQEEIETKYIPEDL